jgi:hypothetical protein
MSIHSHPMFARSLTHAGHVQRFSIAPSRDHGWDVREERDSQVVRHTHLTDWHRVERARSVFTLKIDLLESTGWTES